MANWRLNYSKFISNYPHAVGAEIGVRSGDNALMLLDNLPNIKTLYCVDIWTPKQLQNKEKFLKRVKNQLDKVVVIHNNSEEASKLVPDEELDFIFIDANHRYENVLKDIRCWESKVKKGGIISGHDYRVNNKHPVYDVKKAVDEVYPDVNVRGIIWWVKK